MEKNTRNRVIISLGNGKRIRVPAKVITSVGIIRGKKLWCFANADTKQIIVSNTLPKRGHELLAWGNIMPKNYTVCGDGRVNIGADLIKLAKLDRASNVMVTVEKSGVVKITTVDGRRYDKNAAWLWHNQETAKKSSVRR